MKGYGFHGPATLHIEDLWSENTTLTTGLVDTRSTPTLLRTAVAGQLSGGQLITHTFPLDRMQEVYDVFGDAAETGALEVVPGGERREAVPAYAA
ncbi:zinc-dependent alcohol dehydrogenase family protein [Streptomyces hirsutus]